MIFARTVLAGLAISVSMASAVHAADLLKPADPIYSSELFNFEGLYVGGTAGGALAGSGLYGSLGVVVGANFAVTDGIIVGGEFQGDTFFGGGGLTAFDALALGRVGGFLSDNTMLYGDLGGGIVGGTPVYALGGGVEAALGGQFSIRGDLQGVGSFGALPQAAKATVGLIWHMN